MTVSAATEQISRRLTLQATLKPAAHYLTRPVRLLKNYDRADFQPDLIAGLTVAVILLPQAIAFTLIAELPPEMGLYAAVMGGLAGALWGSSDQTHTGPANAISLLVLSSLAGVAVVGSENYILAAGMLAVLVGALQLLLGLARLGVLVNFVSYSVIVGFATGAGMLIAVRQIMPLLGLSFPIDGVVSIITGTLTHVPEIQPATAAIGIGSIVLLVLIRRVSDRAPGALIVMVLAPLVVYLLGLNEQGVAVIGPLPGGLPPLARLPLLDFELIRTLATGTLAVAAIGLVETAAISKSVAAQTKQRLDSNQEFVGQGMANLFAGFFTGYPVAGSFSRTAVNFRAGARSPMAAIISCLFVLVAMQFLGPVGSYLPTAALSGVLIVSAYRMIDQEEIARILRGGRGDALIMMATLLGTLFLSLETAVLLGVGLSFARYILHTSTPRVQSVVPDDQFEHMVYAPDKPHCPQLGIIEILGDLYFGAVNHVEEYILEDMTAHPDQRFLLLRMNNVNNTDFSGIHMLENVVQQYRDRGGDVYMVHVSYRVRERMEDTEFLDFFGADHILNDDTAISTLFYHVLDPAICIYECPVRVFKECQNLPKRLDLVNLKLQDLSPQMSLAGLDARQLWAELHGRQDEPKPLIVDVREPREYRQGHIAEALSLPLSTFASGVPALPQDRPIVIVCRSSRRSRLAAANLQRSGYDNVSILEGGMTSWEDAGLLEAVDVFADDGDTPL